MSDREPATPVGNQPLDPCPSDLSVSPRAMA